MHIAVIGAGTAGICAAKHALSQGFKVTVFEQAKQLGGTWVFSDSIGKDEYGLEVNSSVYKGLHTLLPKELMGYPDFPITASDASYIPASDMVAFLDLYATQFNVKEHIRFQHYVIRVRPWAKSQWEVIVRDLPNDRISTEIFDAIMVCSGHYNTPLVPTLEGQEKFGGQQIHSHDYRYPESFKGETVLIIGAGPSGLDLVRKISEFANRVTLSHHHKPGSINLDVFASNVNLRPDVVRLSEIGAEFADGVHQEYSVVLYCTGYNFAFPFMTIDCGISVDDNFIQPLYKHCINISRPTMALIGMPFSACAAQMFDLQVRFCLKHFSGEKQLPTETEMLADTDKDMQMRWDAGCKKRKAHALGSYQLKYFEDLSTTADIQNIRPVMTKLLFDSVRSASDDLVNYRKTTYRIVDNESFVKISPDVV